MRVRVVGEGEGEHFRNELLYVFQLALALFWPLANLAVLVPELVKRIEVVTSKNRHFVRSLTELHSLERLVHTHSFVMSFLIDRVLSNPYFFKV